MTKKAKELSTVLQDALLAISDEDSAESRELLNASGINSDAVVQSSFEKMEQLRIAFENRLAEPAQADLFKSVKAKINDFLARSPERANKFLNTYMQENALPMRFAATARVNKKNLEELKDKVNMNDLSRRLDDESNH